jgi:hypothetical protein
VARRSSCILQARTSSSAYRRTRGRLGDGESWSETRHRGARVATRAASVGLSTCTDVITTWSREIAAKDQAGPAQRAAAGLDGRAGMAGRGTALLLLQVRPTQKAALRERVLGEGGRTRRRKAGERERGGEREKKGSPPPLLILLLLLFLFFTHMPTGGFREGATSPTAAARPAARAAALGRAPAAQRTAVRVPAVHSLPTHLL